MSNVEWKRVENVVYLEHLSDRGILENKHHIRVEPGLGVPASDAVEVAERIVDLLQLSEPIGPETSVDSFIDFNRSRDPAVVYARWFFMLQRLPATLKYSFSTQLHDYRLFCIYEGKKYRVTGASRLGDVWLTSNFDQDTGYELRVLLSDCHRWSST